jgi:cytoskeleton protein RodZ
MPTLGETLRTAREKREIPIDDVARETRIAARYLEALEKGDLAELPGSAFGKGYLRTYARFLGLDPEPLVEIYLEEEAEQTREGQIAPARDVLDGLRESVGRGGPEPGETARRVLRVALPGALALGLVAVLVFVVVPWLRSPGTEPAAEAVAAAVEEVPPARASTPPPAPRTRASLANPSRALSEAAGEDPAPERGPTDSGPEPAPRTRPPASRPAMETPPPEETVATPEPAPEPAPRRVAAAEPAPSPPATRAAEPAPSATDSVRLSVSEAGVGTAVVNRALEGQGDRFAEGTRIVFWTRVLGGQPGDEIRHVWIREGAEVGSVTLAVNASHWRTHSRRTLREGAAGSWAVEARDASGRVLARREFLCE